MKPITRRRFLKTGSFAPLVLAAVGSNGTSAVKPTKRPNILFLMTDQHRGDCLGCDGNDVIRTPHLDSLASDGALFKRAYTAVPSCTPARSGLLTGQSPWHHGMLGYGLSLIHI